MKSLIFALLMLAAVPLFAGNVNFVYYSYDYNDYGSYDEYWYDNYWYDGYWVYMPYGYYCVQYVWWYPWWWDWYWARCHWCHNWSWDFFYAGFYVVWYDQGYWWYRPRYGHYVRYRLPHSYQVVRVRARTHGIYLPEKPPREISVPYRENQVMQLARQQDPELFARVEKEQRSGNLEKIRKDYVKQVNQEIAVKNQEYGITDRNMDIEQLAKQSKPTTVTKDANTQRTQQQNKTAARIVEPKPTVKQTTSKNTQSHIQKTSKSESTTRTESPVPAYGRVEQPGSRGNSSTERQVERPRETNSNDERIVPRQANEKENKPDQKQQKNTPQVQREQPTRPPRPQQSPYERSSSRENKR
jgi:hypothetical protein